MQNLSKQDLIEKLEEIEFFPELKSELDKYLSNFIQTKDLEIIEKLLTAGANPNSKEDLDDYLLYLLHEFEVEKNTNGEIILSIIEYLLKNGANPNRVAMNNLRAYDYAVGRSTKEVAALLEKFGADKKLREAI
jgi:ankyrin repeat protein